MLRLSEEAYLVMGEVIYHQAVFGLSLFHLPTKESCREGEWNKNNEKDNVD
jgi:hypothetical protein